MKRSIGLLAVVLVAAGLIVTLLLAAPPSNTGSPPSAAGSGGSSSFPPGSWSLAYTGEVSPGGSLSGGLTFSMSLTLRALLLEAYANDTPSNVTLLDGHGHPQLNVQLHEVSPAQSVSTVASDPPYITLDPGTWTLQYERSTGGPLHIRVLEETG